jgi:hypothetical protein
MRKRISLLIAALMLALTMSFGGATAVFAAPKACDEGDPGCKTETTREHSGNSAADFNNETEETQRGNVNAPGTEPGEETTTCTGPSGKELSPDHPQCS